MCKKEEENKNSQNSVNVLTFPTIPVLLTTHLPTFAVYVASSLYKIMLLFFFLTLLTQQEYLEHKGTENKIK